MQFILLILITAGCLSLQDISKKCYSCVGDDKKMGIYTYYFISVLVTMTVFAVNLSGDIFYEPIMLPYAVGFAICYFAAVLFTLKAIEVGALSLTSLIISYSLLIPSLYGLVFLHEEISTIKVVGLIMLFVSLFCVESGKRDKNGNTKKHDVSINKKWYVYVALAFVGNGLCSTLQKAYQLHSGGRGKSEFMLIALCITAAAFLVLRIVHSDTERGFLPTRTNGGWFGIVSGLCNGIVNLLIMVLSNQPASVVYPSISAGSVVLTIITAKLFFKEKYTNIQNLSFIIGVCSIVCLNI